MGSKGSNTTTTGQTQSYTPDPRISTAGGQALSMATNASGLPFQMPQAPVAGFTPLQTQAFGQIQNLQGMAQPYITEGQHYFEGSAAPITAADVNQYYNPMADNITRQMQNIFGQQNQQNTANLTQAAGGVGADRIAIGQGNLANQQSLAAGQTYAQLYQQALQAAQQQRQMQAGAGYGISQLGPVAQNAALQGTSALGAAGSQQQQLAQARLNSPYYQQLAQIAYPFQTAQYLAGITGGLAGALGGTTTGYGTSTPPSPSTASQIIGGTTAGIGALGSAGVFDGFGTGKGGNAGVPSGISFRRGGSIPHYASGGGYPEDNIPGNDNFLSPIPYIPLQPTSGAFHTELPKQQPQQQQKSDSGGGFFSDVLGLATTALPFFLAEGGAVNPYNMGEGFAPGGDVDLYGVGNPALYGDYPGQPYQTFGDILSRAKDYYGSMLPSYGGGTAITPGDLNTYPVPESTFGTQGAPPRLVPSTAPPASFADRMAPAKAFPEVVPMVAGETPRSALAGSMTAAGQPPMRNLGLGQPVTDGTDTGAGTNLGIPVTTPRGATAGPGVPTLNQDMNAEDYSLPADQKPYAGASDQNVGQKIASSPWLALLNAGAAMMSTPGTLGTAIGAGIKAGTGTLEQQRKQLQTEEGINQKAQQLYQQAKEHLDQYQRKTPHEVATEAHQAAVLAQGKYKWIPGFGTGPDGQPVYGAYRAPSTGNGQPEFFPGIQFTARKNTGVTDNALLGAAQRAIIDPLSPYYNKPLAEVIAGMRSQVSQSHAPVDAAHAGAPAVGSTPQNPLPPPAPGQPRVKGMYYRLPDGTVRRWNG